MLAENPSTTEDSPRAAITIFEAILCCKNNVKMNQSPTSLFPSFTSVCKSQLQVFWGHKFTVQKLATGVAGTNSSLTKSSEPYYSYLSVQHYYSHRTLSF